MAGLDARNDNFISLLIDISGRVRPGDLPGLSDAEAVALLEQYRAAHPERALNFAEGVLSVATAPPAATPTPAAPAAAAVVVAPAAAADPAAATFAPPAGAPVAAPVVEEGAAPPAETPADQLPSWYFGDEAGVQGLGATDAQQAPPSPVEAGTLGGPATGETTASTLGAGTAPEPTAGDAAEFAMPPARAGAKPWIIIGIVVVVLVIAAVAAAIALGGLDFIGLG